MADADKVGEPRAMVSTSNSNRVQVFTWFKVEEKQFIKAGEGLKMIGHSVRRWLIVLNLGEGQVTVNEEVQATEASWQVYKARLVGLTRGLRGVSCLTPRSKCGIVRVRRNFSSFCIIS